ncbi:Concanavalin A-like lectin/glucanase, subgroup [Artemisia annua]|uniref:Concanavalin A-like lectin/glucanase, subgroup n=1 Tax=Artemisia annua TaxID=35608 RepID=A0A2U1NMV8_ARTAN|nr:Concanavalin A-like lectin/glucanase, subgroup [Artemisia annua]
MRGAHKAAQLATNCLNRDVKARPLMSEIYEALKPLPNLKDMACKWPYFQAMQSERTGGNSSRNGSKGQLMRSLSISNSPYHNQPHRSPKPSPNLSDKR